jgi:RNA-binding protein
MALTSKERAALRAQAHALDAAVHVGHQGLTPTVAQTIDDCLRTRELVKIQFTRTADLDVKQTANELSAKLNADVVQVIGRTATLYREKEEE